MSENFLAGENLFSRILSFDKKKFEAQKPRIPVYLLSQFMYSIFAISICFQFESSPLVNIT
jgi:hypothetical protein